MSTAPTDRNGFQVAIFCALPLEAENVQSVFDVCWEDQDKQYGKAAGDQNSYTTGMIGKYNVVLVHMPSMGGNSAALAAAGLRSSFRGVQLALVVGICGVSPVHPTTKKEIVLGDVIISTAVIQYDFGRQYPGGFRRKHSVDDSLGRANPEIRAFVNMLATRQNRQRFNKKLEQLLHSKEFQSEVPTAIYPGVADDRLYESSYLHRHRSDMTCDKCIIDVGTCSRNCDELECEDEKSVTRDRHAREKEYPEEGASRTPLVHLGRFGSANTVMKSGLDRDRISAADEVTAFEMEGAGVWEQYPTVVIKAACDYADSHKNKQWQAYAAAVAAAGLKVFLKEWVISELPSGTDELSPPVWHVLFDPMPGFVGREDELRTLERKLLDPNGRRVVSLLGLGGVGKSRLALEFAHQIRSKHPQHSVFWVQASEPLILEKDMHEIGRKLKITGIEDEKADVKALVKQRLSLLSGGKWLLILDNADNEVLWGRRSSLNQSEFSLVDCLPRTTTNGSILVTTRTRRVASFLAEKEVIKLDALAPGEAADLFRSKLEDPHAAAKRETLLTLVTKLATLPLAVVQAASYVNMTETSVQTYLDLLDQPEAETVQLLSEDFGDASRYPDAINPVAITWLISFQHIQQRHHLAADFLSTMACLHEKGIPLSLLPKGGSKIDTVNALSVLTGYSFVTKHSSSGGTTDGEELYDLHRLVKLAARSWLKNEGCLHEWSKTCVIRLAQLFPSRDHQYKGLWTMYLPHAQLVCDEHADGDFAEKYDLLEKMGLCLVVDGKYDEAVRMHTAVVTWREHMLGTSDDYTLEAYANLGEALNGQGNFARAEAYLKTAVNGLDKEHSSTERSLGNLASTYRKQGRWPEAEELQIQELKTRKTKLGPDHPSTLTSMNNLALTYSDQGRWREAEELQIQELKICKTKLGPDHPSTLTSMANLASTYRNQGRWTEAEQLFIQVMKTFKTKLGADHPDTLTSMANLASTYRNQGRWTEAEQLEVQVIKTCKTKLGADHPDTLTSINNLAFTWKELGRDAEAIQLMTECVQRRTRILGAPHPHSLSSQETLSQWVAEGRDTSVDTTARENMN